MTTLPTQTVPDCLIDTGPKVPVHVGITSDNGDRVPERAPRGRFLEKVSGVGAMAFADQMVVSGTRFLTTVMVGRLCGARELGAYSLGFAAIILAGCVQEALLSKPFTVHSHRFTGRRRSLYCGSMMLMLAALSLASSLVMAIVALLFWFGLGPAEAVPVLAILTIVVPCSLLWECARRLSFAQMQFKQALVIDSIAATIQILGLAALFASGLLAAATAYAVIGMAMAVVGGGWVWIHRSDMTFATWNRVQFDWLRNWRFGKWIAAAQVVGSVHGHVVYWMLAILIGAASVGIFAAAMTIVLLANPILLAAANLIGPMTARTYAAEGARALARLTRKAILLSLVATAVFVGAVALLREHLLGILFGAEFLGQGTVVVLLASCTIWWAIAIVVSAALAAVQRPAASFHATVLGMVTTTVVAFPLLSKWDAVGGAAALLAGSVVAAITQGFALLRFLRAEIHHEVGIA